MCIRDRYTTEATEEICPARISVEMTNRVQETAIKVFRIIQGRGFARVDMIIKGEEIFVLDINTIPGLTPNSLFPKEAKAMGISYSRMLDRLIEMALK
jgi:D-alanine-D-alanine ligase